MKTTEGLNPLSADIDLRSSEEICRIINSEDQRVAAAVAEAIPRIARAVDLAVERLGAGGRLLYAGAGTSGRIGILDAVECPPTFGIPAERISGIMAGGFAACYRAVEASEDHEDQGAADLEQSGINHKDVVVAIAASGRTPYTRGALRRARELGAATIAISCNRGAEMSSLADVAIEVDVGPEIVSGSTRMKAGTAQKLVLNMLSTATMIRLGMVFSHWMINVQATNDKLRLRALRILTEAGRVSDEQARQLLAEAGSLPAALLMALAGVDADTARQALVKGGVRQALQSLRRTS